MLLQHTSQIDEACNGFFEIRKKYPPGGVPTPLNMNGV